ncbi:MAG TPA: FliA/WhiG family RNA polymerase sigma factor [Actinomycetota bacterium]|nr:FliA/WhiG family RNA polymerase sigma factor [Actinomycetota bacterium]
MARLAEELANLWRQFKDHGSKEAKDRLTVHYSPLVKYVASRVGTGLPANVEQGDLISDGMIGLMDAIDKFQPERQIKFETYAIPRIKGEIIDALRKLDWVPRSVRSRARQLDKANAELESRLKRAPSDSEVAEHMGMSKNELHDVITQIASLSMLALDEPVSMGGDRGETVSLIDTLSDYASGNLMAGLEGNETRAMLSYAINSLGEREKFVVTLYYFEGLTLSEIGDVLHVTESRVCQIHTKAVGQLRVKLTEADED